MCLRWASLLWLLLHARVNSHVPLQSVFAIEALLVELATFMWTRQRSLVLVHACVMALDVFWIGEELVAVEVWTDVFLLPSFARSTGSEQPR